MREKSSILNSWIVSIFLFQFGIFLPFSLITNIEYIYILTTLILFILSLMNNKFSLNPIFIILSLSIITYMIISFIFHNIEKEIIILVLGGFIAKGISGLYISSNKLNFKHLYKSLFLFSWINLIILSISILFFSLDDYVGYMRLGYAIVPSAIILIGDILVFKSRVLNCIGIISSILLLLFFGNRGVYVVIILFILLLIFYVLRPNIKLLIGSSIIMILVFIFSIFDLFSKIIFYLYSEIGIYSYNLMKFTQAFEDGFISSSSGRDILYTQAFNYFLEKPILGNGIGFTFIYTDTSAHNIVLQILIESGILGLLVSIFIIVAIFIQLSKVNDIYIRLIMVIFISLSIGRLSVSSDLWLRPELWILVGIIISLFNFRKKFSADNNCI